MENIRLYGDNIIADFYEDGMRSVSVKTAKFLEDRLVTTDGYRHYLSYNDALAAGVMAVELDTLKEKRIITVEKGEKNQRVIELTHDVLCLLVLQSRKERKLKEEADRLAAKTKAMRRRNRVMLLSLSAMLAGASIVSKIRSRFADTCARFWMMAESWVSGVENRLI